MRKKIFYTQPICDMLIKNKWIFGNIYNFF